MVQLTQEALLTLIRDASTGAAAQAVAHFVAHHLANPPPLYPCKSRELSSVLEEDNEQKQKEMNNRISKPEVAQTQEQNLPQ
ncbi:UNVERIFIED_CONTAM: hypothetical protein Sradi_6514400 [Sesamum radiatum]|uniref:Uncharacterized protein n=1 Tax=Sesamum radiatum TaxID=300843 RepID=A0AAW2JVG6_SESRA